ncbi:MULTISPECIES: class F sortase [unclassified Nocardioides]|uniref:class F sortase n=1 Tax=unclassified Nocardioides TaxID=2615069 RepID=UPI00360B41E0
MPDRLRAVVAVIGLALVAAGGVWWTGADQPGTRAAPGAGEVAGPARPQTGTTARPVIARPTPGAPRRLVIPVLGVDAPVVPVRAPGRTLVPPQDPGRLGWWADGARPGAAEGSALVAGHSVHDGGGALDDLEHLGRGDAVVVRTDRGRIGYEVRRVRVYSKGRVAEDAARLFSQDVPGRLVLVTCEDWDGARFLSNVVVVATPRR